MTGCSECHQIGTSYRIGVYRILLETVESVAKFPVISSSILGCIGESNCQVIHCIGVIADWQRICCNRLGMRIGIT